MRLKYGELWKDLPGEIRKSKCNVVNDVRKLIKRMEADKKYQSKSNTVSVVCDNCMLQDNKSFCDNCEHSINNK